MKLYLIFFFAVDFVVVAIIIIIIGNLIHLINGSDEIYNLCVVLTEIHRILRSFVVVFK